MVRVFLGTIAMLTMLFVSQSIVFSTEGKKEFCGFTYSIFSDDNNPLLYLGCAGSMESLELISINPQTLDVVNSFSIEGLLQGAYLLNDGESLLILVVETDGNPDTTEGALQKVNAKTGELLSEYVFQHAPLSMVVDPNENFAYVTTMVSYDLTATITKISLSDFTMKSFLMFGINPDSIAISHDGSKIYIKSEEVFIKDDGGEIEFYWRIGVINTSSMKIKDTIRIPVIPASLQTGSNNQLFISNAMPLSEENMDYSIIVANTETDEVVKNLSFNEVGAWDMAYDSNSNRLYGIASPRTLFDPISGEYTHESSGLVLSIDCLSFSHDVISLSNEPLWSIALSSTSNNKSRLFGITKTDSPMIYYKDLD